MALRAKRTKIGSACQRCRRQKLKCDIQRPCTLCVRAGLDCETGPSDQWRAVQMPPAGNEGSPILMRKRASRQPTSPEQQLETDDKNGDDSGFVGQPWSSSTMSLVEAAFQLHDSTTPDMSMITAFPGGQSQPCLAHPESRDVRSIGRNARRTPKMNPRLHASRSPISELASLLPSRKVAALLVDTYFDRVHWFMLIFQQDDFRQIWQQMYDHPIEQVTDSYPNPGFISTFLVVIAIALQYTGSHRSHLLETNGIDAMAFEERILSTVRAKILDIVALGSLEAVQTCILLGTYYLYHGSPELAWPVCGCGLRVAQALNLHRKMPSNGSISPEVYRQNETRKRCWWAIFEIETFCSMSYGYPHGIKDIDCDVELLDPLAKSSTCLPQPNFDSTHQCSPSLLSYKYLMSKLSVLLKDALTDLYGLGSYRRTTGRLGGSSSLQNLVQNVSSLDAQLQLWIAEIPDSLRLNKSSTSSVSNYDCIEDMDRDIGASGPRFESHIYQLQALALKLAYENARILVHRPLLAYKMVRRADNQINHMTENTTRNPFQMSLQACRDAALKTSELGESHVFSLAAGTYAASFLGIHTFTAGLTLCILSSLEPLAAQSYRSKIGLRQLMRMQAHLASGSRSKLAAQGLEILKRLTRLVMEKEFKDITCPGIEAPQVTQDQNAGIESGDSRDVTGHLPDQHVPFSMEGIADEGTPVDYIADPAMFQALYDFDQVLSGYNADGPLEPLFPDHVGFGASLAQEQAWIWGIDSLAQSPDVG